MDESHSSLLLGSPFVPSSHSCPSYGCVYPLMEVSPCGCDPELDARLRVRLSFSPKVLIEKVEFRTDILRDFGRP